MKRSVMKYTNHFLDDRNGKLCRRCKTSSPIRRSSPLITDKHVQNWGCTNYRKR
ncbi:hypothetical protein GW17_00010553 [Ensete ventricosum]|nr:hypothetical protein GW17_00010553 [Ensete ventricosum]RZR84451.1 hypothetical protein BHM03_00011289 [Ensete ventricosum]